MNAVQAELADYLSRRIRTVPDWPQPGVQFRDITTLLADAQALRKAIDAFAAHYADARIDYVAGLEARGFIMGPALAYVLGAGFIPVRKAGKLPHRTIAESYELEYGTASLEIHADACGAGNRVLIFDDLIATGGTMLAGLKLLQRLGATVIGGAAIIDLPDLGGAQRLRAAGLELFTLCAFGGH